MQTKSVDLYGTKVTKFRVKEKINEEVGVFLVLYKNEKKVYTIRKKINIHKLIMSLLGPVHLLKYCTSTH